MSRACCETGLKPAERIVALGRIMKAVRRAQCWVCGLAGLCASAWGTMALAQQQATGIPDPSIASSLPAELADPAGLRQTLASHGILYGAHYIGEAFSNRSGGIARGSLYTGRVELYADVDLGVLAGLKGLAFHVNAYDIHGKGLAATKVGTLNAMSSIEAEPATRLFEMWFEQKLLDDTLSVRFGQLAADSEFMLTDSGTQFINASTGWPAIAAVNLPNGGVAYPLAAPGARVEWAATNALTVRAGVYNDDPAGPCAGDAQLDCDPHGLEFRLSDHPFIIAELAYKYGEGMRGWLPGTIKIGGWIDLAQFDDQHFDTAGVSLANPLSNGAPIRHRSDQSLYAAVDQKIYSGVSGHDAISVFARAMVAPSDRNLVDFNMDGGIVFTGFVPGREKDTFGMMASFAHISSDAKRLDHDALNLGGVTPVRKNEWVLEANYIAHIVPGWTVQPDFQYVWNPGGGAPDASGTAYRGNSAVIGIRTSVNY